MLRNRQVRVGGIFNARVSDDRWRTCARNGWPINPAVLALPLHISGMSNTLFLVLVSDLMLVACILAAFLLDRLTERR